MPLAPPSKRSLLRGNNAVMVSLVLVSHVRELAQGVKILAEQMTQGQVPIALAAGVESDEQPVGTDALRVAQAIREVYSPDGVVVFMDLGSALLSAEMALEFLEPAQRERVFLSDAPFVEGALAAAAQAATGAAVEQVLAEARAALQVKQAQIQRPEVDIPGTGPLPAPGAEVRVVVPNPLGLHARPAARFVSTAARYQAQIRVRNLTRGTEWVNAKSIGQVTALGVRQGHEIAIAAQGPDAEQALDALRRLVEEGFGEMEAPPPPPPTARPRPGPPAADQPWEGIPASPGAAVGPALRLAPAALHVPERATQDPEAEWQRLEDALAQAEAEIRSLRARTAARAGEAQAAIFDAHALFLADPDLRARARALIWQGRSAAWAWQHVLDELIEAYQHLDDPYMQARIADLRDVQRRVLRLLLGQAAPVLQGPTPGILVADDLTPSDTAQLDPEAVQGIVTARGGPTSHVAVLARSLGIPAVVGVGPEVLTVEPGTPLAVDGDTGQVWVRPPAAVVERLRGRRAAQAAATRADTRPAFTRDGHRVPVWANIVTPDDARRAVALGAEGVGLMRTEFLFVGREAPPDEDEQYRVYRAVVEALQGRPLVIRTADIGGDKAVPYLQEQPEANPFLGWRGVRMALERPELFLTQARAILRAGARGPVWAMLPMVATLDEVRAAKALWAQAQDELQARGVAFDAHMPLGIMVEIPAAALLAEALAREVAFFSLGTNDLSQYTLAADRTNPRVAHLADAWHPAVLRLIARTVEAARSVGIPVGVCGELAGDPAAAVLLLGLGVDELSVNPPMVPQVKAALRVVTAAQARAWAHAALKMTSAAQVRAWMRARLAEAQTAAAASED